MPLLKYYYADDIPVYSTSISYSGSVNALQDRDLDGLIFCDMPWVFTHQMEAQNWPEQLNSYNRLYALGMDSYILTTKLRQLSLSPASINEKSGILYLNDANVIRLSSWGKFKQGVPEPL